MAPEKPAAVSPAATSAEAFTQAASQGAINASPKASTPSAELLDETRLAEKYGLDLSAERDAATKASSKPSKRSKPGERRGIRTKPSSQARRS
jgi:hypothetical protein